MLRISRVNRSPHHGVPGSRLVVNDPDLPENRFPRGENLRFLSPVPHDSALPESLTPPPEILKDPLPQVDQRENCSPVQDPVPAWRGKNPGIQENYLILILPVPVLKYRLHLAVRFPAKDRNPLLLTLTECYLLKIPKFPRIRLQLPYRDRIGPGPHHFR